MLQFLISVAGPEQFLPSPEGGGESQTLNRDFFPPWQVAEHFVHSLHDDHLPSIFPSKFGIINKKMQNKDRMK